MLMNYNSKFWIFMRLTILPFFSGRGREQLIRFLVSLQNSFVDGVRIVLGRAQVYMINLCVRIDCNPYFMRHRL